MPCQVPGITWLVEGRDARQRRLVRCFPCRDMSSQLQDVPTRQIQICMLKLLFVDLDIWMSWQAAASNWSLWCSLSISFLSISRLTFFQVLHRWKVPLQSHVLGESFERQKCIPASSLRFYLFRGCSWIESPAYTSKIMTVLPKRISDIQWKSINIWWTIQEQKWQVTSISVFVKKGQRRRGTQNELFSRLPKLANWKIEKDLSSRWSTTILLLKICLRVFLP